MSFSKRKKAPANWYIASAKRFEASAKWNILAKRITYLMNKNIFLLFIVFASCINSHKQTGKN